MMDPKDSTLSTLGAPLLAPSRDSSGSTTVGASSLASADPADAQVQPPPKKAEKESSELLTWDIRNGFGYDWLVMALTLFASVSLVIGKLIEVFGEVAVSKALVGALALGCVPWAYVGLRRFPPWQPRRGLPDLSGMPLWRKTLFQTTAYLLQWQFFYTGGFSYWIAAFLLPTGIVTEEVCDDSWFYWLLFPVKSGRPCAWSELYSFTIQNPIGFIWVQVLQLTSLLTEIIMLNVILPADRRGKDTYGFTDTMMTSLQSALILISANLWISGGTPVYLYIYNNFRLTDGFNSGSSVVGWFLCLIMFDFAQYWWHRASHIMSWLWTYHSVHHSSDEYNLTLGWRNSFADLTPGNFLRIVPLAFFYPLEMAATCMVLQGFWQYNLHSAYLPEAPFLEYIFYTASLHRVHHARNHDRLGKNHGFVFSIWDRIFGTYQPEYMEEYGGGRDALCYGVVPQTGSWDPVWANGQFWYHMFKKQVKWDSWMAPFRHWTPPGGKCPPLGHRLNMWEKYDPRSCSTWRWYAALEGTLVFLLMSVAVSSPSIIGTDAPAVIPNAATHHVDRSFTIEEATKEAEGLVNTVFPIFQTFNVQAAVVFILALWSCSCVGRISSAESEFTFRSEALRQLVLLGCLAGYLFGSEKSLPVSLVINGVPVTSNTAAQNGGGSGGEGAVLQAAGPAAAADAAMSGGMASWQLLLIFTGYAAVRGLGLLALRRAMPSDEQPEDTEAKSSTTFKEVEAKAEQPQEAKVVADGEAAGLRSVEVGEAISSNAEDELLKDAKSDTATPQAAALDMIAGA